MFARNTIFSVSLLYAATLIQITQTCDNTCVFNKQYNGHKKVIKIQAPKQEKWVTPKTLDEIDKTIFGKTSLPYSYTSITNASKKHVYVKKEKYQKLIVTAQEQLHNKKQAIEKELENIGDDITKAGNFMKLSLAQDRLKEYEKILKESDCYRHKCPGIILTMQTKRCIALWAFWNQKQN